MTKREISKEAIRILVNIDSNNRTSNENMIINNALTIWEETGELYKVADLLVSRL